MAGNSSRKGAIRKGKKGATAGTGGHGKQRLAGKGPTPRAEERTKHPAARRAAAAAKRDQRQGAARHRGAEAPELLVGRNPVAEALRAKVPAMALYVASGVEADERVADALRIAGNRGLSILEISRGEMDRMTGAILHQGIALQVPPFKYTDFNDLLTNARESSAAPLLVALDGVTDPRNLGAVIRSAVAFGADGVILPERRAASVTAVAWRTSAGTAARIPVAKVTNLVRALKDAQEAGMFVIGLDADGDQTLDELTLADSPIVIVVGSEGRGVSRLVTETCDITLSIPMSEAAESLNASVAAAVTLAEVARRRRLA
ncbi:23S rRNA (guanosine2251-2'-O)-methyltransferase [Frankineae bacterium MT45]|nr:23S rRNA (guanosine2251-2'-O)-methyltransferase [Frankineae bacterium MT45]